jgi:hypothetical protein
VLDQEIMALDARLQAERAHRLRARLALIFERNTVLAYRRLFLGPDGELTPDAVRVLGDLAARALIGVSDAAATSGADLRDRAGKRSIVLHLMRRLDQSGVRLKELALKLRETPNE